MSAAEDPHRPSLRRWLLRWLVRLLIRPVLRAWVPLRLQRWLLDLLSAVAGSPRRPGPEKMTVRGVRTWFYPARGDPDAAVLYLHGGGYVAGSPRSHRNISARLGLRLGADVYTPAYRLAPEHPFPAAIDDAWTVFQALVEHPRGYRRILVIGDSAGGGLALGLAVRARDAGGRSPDAIVAFSPLVDLAERAEKGKDYDDMIDPRWADKVCAWYLGEVPCQHPWASPVYADVTGLPPTLIQAGGDELLVEQTRRMGAHLQAGGVDARVEIYPHVWHVFQTSAGQLPDADRALDAVAAFVRARDPGPQGKAAAA